MKDFFLRNYRNKTDSELEKIIDSKSKYENAAREAAFEVLKERNGQNQKLDVKKADFEAEKKVTIERKKLYSNELPEGLYLYSELVVLLFTVLFSSLVGGILLYLNFKELKKNEEANNALSIGLLFFVLGLGTYIFIAEFGILTRLFAALIFSKHFWSKHIGSELEYYRKTWVPPLLISLGVLFLLSILNSLFLVKLFDPS